MLRIEPGVFCMLGLCSATELCLFYHKLVWKLPFAFLVCIIVLAGTMLSPFFLYLISQHKQAGRPIALPILQTGI